MIDKAAILIDGGYFLKRLPSVRSGIDTASPEEVVRAVDRLVGSHLKQLNDTYQVSNPFRLLYRCFYYDALPYDKKGHSPIGRRSIDYAKSDVAFFRNKLFDALRARTNFVLRLGQVEKPGDSSWTLKPKPQKSLLKGDMDVSDLRDSDFVPDLHQKGVDIRIGLDIASIALKEQADTIILVSGDSDFVPAAKLARREGARFILDPLWQNVSPDLLEHIDGLRSGFPNPRRETSNNE